MEEAIVYLPDDFKDICRSDIVDHVHPSDRIGFSCMNMDSLVLQGKGQHSFQTNSENLEQNRLWGFIIR